MEFTASKKEIMRRKAAYAVLVTSMFIGFLLFSKRLDVPLLTSFYISFLIAFSLLGVISFRFLNLLMRMKIRLSDQEIERQSGDITERFLLSEIETIKIKRRSHGDVREIYIFFRNRKKLFISAFEQDFDRLARDLIKKMDKGIPISEKRELFNYDHLLFYPILGLIISFCFVFFLKGMIQTDHHVLKYYKAVISTLAFSMAVFFAYWKPNAKRSGKRNVAIDYILAVVMFILSMYIFNMGANF